MSAATPHDNSRSLGVREMLCRGWMVYRPRMSVDDIDRIQEEGEDPTVSWLPAQPNEQFKNPASVQLEHIVRYVFHNVVQPLHLHPLSSLLSAIEDRVGSKIFVRPTHLLGEGIEAVSKFFLLQAFRDRSAAGPPAFYGVLLQVDPDDQGAGARYLMRRLTLAHEAMHHLLHVSPWLAEKAGDDREFDRIQNEYAQLLARESTPNFGPPPDQAECEAEMAAFLAILAKGYLRMRVRRRDELRSIAREVGGGIDVDKLADGVEQCASEVNRPVSLDKLVIPRFARPGPEINPAIASDAWFDDLFNLARSLAEESRERPFSWVCRAIEDRFLPRKGENGRRACNVLVKLRRFEETEEPFCVIERKELASALDDADAYLRQRKNPPHLIRYTIFYPADWDIINSPRHRIRVLQWLGLIDRFEWQQPPKKPGTTMKHLSDYTREKVTEAMTYAFALDALVADVTDVDRYTEEQAAYMLSKSPFGFDSLMARPAWAQAIRSLLASTESPNRVRELIVPDDDESSDPDDPSTPSNEWPTPSPEDIDRMRSVYQQLEGEGHLRQYSGKYIVLWNDQVVDYDDDWLELAKRVQQRFRTQGAFLHRVGDPLPEAVDESAIGLHREYSVE